MSIHLLCLDFDGTIMVYENASAHFHADVIRALNKLAERGVAWITNSGRDFDDQRRILERSRAHGLRHDPAALICREGLIYNRVNQHYEPVEPWNTRARESMRRLHGDLQADQRDVLRDLVQRYEPHEAHFHRDATVFLMGGREADTARLVAELDGLATRVPGGMVLRNGEWIAILPRHLGKGNTLRTYLEMNNLSGRHVLAIGDHGNDISMLDGSVSRLVGCPGDAHPAVIETVSRAGGYVAREAGPLGTLDVLCRFDLA